MKTLLALVLTFTLLTGCATTGSHHGWIPGTLTSMADGSQSDFYIQKRMVIGGSASGGVYATNAISHQTFTGIYTGLMGGGHSYDWASATATRPGGIASADAVGGSTWQNNIANTQTILNDGHGTVINIRMQIQAGWFPHGFGGGKDNHGHEYQVQF